MALQVAKGDCFLDCKVTVTLIDFDTGNPIQQTVIIKKNRECTLHELAMDAVGFFNEQLSEKGYKYRLDSKATNYSVIPCADNKLKEYTQKNIIGEFTILDFCFEYILANVTEIHRTKCCTCICF